MNNNNSYLNIIEHFGSKTILVIGDLILDVYLKGKTARLCPEAPVPVVDIEEECVALGGAANTAFNLRSLGATVLLITVIGTDANGDKAMQLLNLAGINNRYVIRRTNRKTLTKTRVMSGRQLIARIDQGTDSTIESQPREQVATAIERAYGSCDCLMISDYNKGVITTDLIEKINQLQQHRPSFIAVDSKRLPFFSSLSPSCAKPNYEEIRHMLDLPPTTDRLQQVSKVAGELYSVINASIILATMDEDGSLIVENGVPTYRASAPTTDRPHVSGAGDTYISAFVLSYLNSGDPSTSAEIASAAASVAIGKASTASCSQGELKTFFNIHHKFVADLHELGKLCDTYHAAGKRIVFTNGCFDILHSGHVAYLHQARALGDVLIVGLNKDDSIRRIKGSGRPINSLADRIQVLAGLSSVDHIIPFGELGNDTPIPLIEVSKPNIFVKGGDYTMESLPEADTVERFGGKIALVDRIPQHSTTHIISKIRGHEVLGSL